MGEIRTTEDLVAYIGVTKRHPKARVCPSCRTDLMTVGLDRIVYAFEPCDCAITEGVAHLYEQMWHRACFARRVATERIPAPDPMGGGSS